MSFCPYIFVKLTFISECSAFSTVSSAHTLHVLASLGSFLCLPFSISNSWSEHLNFAIFFRFANLLIFKYCSNSNSLLYLQ